METWKLQLPLFTNVKPAECLIYNENRTKVGQIPVTPEIEALFPRGMMKIFVRGTMDKWGNVNINRRVPYEDW